jgi:hypothetical protein
MLSLIASQEREEIWFLRPLLTLDCGTLWFVNEFVDYILSVGLLDGNFCQFESTLETEATGVRCFLDLFLGKNL